MKKIEIQKPFEGINFVPSKKFITPKTIEAGMFYYADGLIYPELIKGNQVSAIVASVEKNHGLAMGLREAALPWSSDRLYIGMPDEIDGKEATKRILDAAQKKGKSAEAAEWCAAYAFDGIEAGTMFMPSNVEWTKFFTEYQKLRESFDKLKLVGLKGTGYYWSSCEHPNYICSAWVVRRLDGHWVYGSKRNDYDRVRCVLDFQF